MRIPCARKHRNILVIGISRFFRGLAPAGGRKHSSSDKYRRKEQRQHAPCKGLPFRFHEFVLLEKNQNGAQDSLPCPHFSYSLEFGIVHFFTGTGGVKKTPRFEKNGVFLRENDGYEKVYLPVSSNFFYFITISTPFQPFF